MCDSGDDSARHAENEASATDRPGFFEIFGLVGKQVSGKRMRKGLREAFQTLGGSAPVPPPPTIREAGAGPDEDKHRQVQVSPFHDPDSIPVLKATMPLEKQFTSKSSSPDAGEDSE